MTLTKTLEQYGLDGGNYVSKCRSVEGNEALVDKIDHTWAQLSCTDTNLKYYGGEPCESFFFFIFLTVSSQHHVWKNVCDWRVGKSNLRILNKTHLRLKSYKISEENEAL